MFLCKIIYSLLNSRGFELDELETAVAHRGQQSGDREAVGAAIGWGKTGDGNAGDAGGEGLAGWGARG
jgi:hypothetical protein